MSEERTVPQDNRLTQLPESMRADFLIYLESPSTGLVVTVRLGNLRSLPSCFEPDAAKLMVAEGLNKLATDWRLMTSDEIDKYLNHEMKSWPWFFQAFMDGNKLHDLRQKDRDFQIGDVVVLKEYDPRTGKYSGSELAMEISYMTSNDTPCALSSNALARDHVILSLRKWIT